MSQPISREDIAEIYEQLGVIEMRKAADAVSNLTPQDDPVDDHLLDRSFDFYERADQFREIDKMRPLRPFLGPTYVGFQYVRATENVW